MDTSAGAQQMTTNLETKRQLTRQAAHTADLLNDVLCPLGPDSRRDVHTLIADAQQHTTAGRYTNARQLLDQAYDILEG